MRERRVLKLDLDPEGKSQASIRDIVLLTRKEEGLLLAKGGSTESVIVGEGSSGFSGDRGSPAKVEDRARYKRWRGAESLKLILCLSCDQSVFLSTPKK